MSLVESPRPDRNRLLCALALLVLAAARIGLMGDIPGACRNLEVDDFLYARSADAIAEGRWLGDYDWKTLTKMPGYPAWLALQRLVGLPTRLGQELLWIGALLALFSALRRLGLGRFLALLVFSVLLFHPVAAWGQNNLLVRETIHHSQVLLVAAFLLHLLAPASDLRRLGQAVLLGLATVFCWYSREESLWLVGVLAIGLLPAFLLERRRAGTGAAMRLLFIAVIPVAVLVHAAGLGIRELNRAHYGAPVLIAFEDPDFKAAMGAIMRAEPEPEHPFHPIRDETLTELMTVSPALAELRGAIEGPAFRASFMLDPEGNRIANFFTFLLRAASAEKGRHASLGAAKAWYRRIATEINRHLDEEPARYGPRRDSVMPPFRLAHAAPIARDFLGLTAEMARLRFEGRPGLPQLPYSDCPPEREALVKRVMRDSAEPSLSRWSWRTRILERVLEVWRLLLPFAAVLAGLIVLFRLSRLGRSPLETLDVAGLVLIAIAFLRAGLCAGVNVVYSPLGTTYLVSGFVLLAGGLLLVLLAPLNALRLPALVGSPAMGALSLLALIAGLVLFGRHEAEVPRRFLQPSEARLLRAGPEPDAIEIGGLRAGLRPGDSLALRVEGAAPHIVLWPWLRRRATAVDVYVAGRIRGAEETPGMRLRARHRSEPDEAWISTEMLIPVDAAGRFEHRLELATRHFDHARLDGALRPGQVIEIRRFTLIPSSSPR